MAFSITAGYRRWVKSGQSPRTRRGTSATIATTTISSTIVCVTTMSGAIAKVLGRASVNGGTTSESRVIGVRGRIGRQSTARQAVLN